MGRGGWQSAFWSVGGRGILRPIVLAHDSSHAGDTSDTGAAVRPVRPVGAAGSDRQARVLQPGCPMLCIDGQRNPFPFHSLAWIGEPSSPSGHRALSIDVGHWVTVQRVDELDRAMGDWIAVASACGKVGSGIGWRAAGSARPRHEHNRE
jgi:hypothetical protein